MPKKLIRDKIKDEIYENADGVDCWHACKMLDESACKVAEAFDDKKLKGWLMNYSKNQKIRNVIGKMMCNIKTHKDPGEVSVRLIHSSVGNPGAALSSLISKICRWKIKDLKHIYQNTGEFLEKLHALDGKLPANVIVWTADIGDFYLSGKHSELISSSFKHVEDYTQRKALEDALENLLYYQFVESSFAQSGVLRVRKGTGMGSRHSGEVSDLGFFECVEKDLIKQEVLDAHKILLYGRYRDDIIVIEEDKEHLFGKDSWYQMFCKKAGEHGYVIEMEQMLVGCFTSVHYLDLWIHKTSKLVTEGKLEYDLYTKDTAQKIPLGRLSAHTESTHNFWPLTEIRRYKERCARKVWFDKARNDFCAKLNKEMFPTEYVKKLKEMDYEDIGKRTGKAPENNENNPKPIYWVLPYHPNVKKMRLDKIANEVLKEYGEEYNYKISIAWSKRHQALGDEMRALVQ